MNQINEIKSRKYDPIFKEWVSDSMEIPVMPEGVFAIRHFSVTNQWIDFVVVLKHEEDKDLAIQAVSDAMDLYWSEDDLCYGDCVEEMLKENGIYDYEIAYHDPYVDPDDPECDYREYEDAWEHNIMVGIYEVMPYVVLQ